MLGYAVSAALNSGLFAEVIVSSDEPSIGHLAEQYGAVFVLRPAELASDSAGLADVARHVLDELRKRGLQPEAICQSMPNCPLVRSADFVEHWRLFNEHHRQFQISVVPYRGVYPQWALAADEHQRGRWIFGEKNLVRSQELARAFCPTGAIWWARTTDFLEQNAFYGSPFHLAAMDANRGIDIDDEEDFKLAELLVYGLTARDGQSPLEPVSRALAMERVSG